MFKKKEIFILLLIFILAAAKYFYQALVINPFELDQEFLALEAWKLVKEYKFTLIGAPTSIGGLFIGPFYSYLVALAMMLTQFHPFTINLLSAFWATLTPIAIYLIGQKLFSPLAGAISGLLASISLSFLSIPAIPPLVIPVSLISLLIFYLLIQVKQQPRWFYLIAVLAGFSLNLHFTGIYLILIIIFWLIFNPSIIRQQTFLTSLIILVFFTLPLIIFEQRHNFFISHNLFKFLQAQTGFNNPALPSRFFASFKLMLGLSGELINNFSQNNLLVGAIASLFFLIHLLTDKSFNQATQLLFAWLIIPIIFNGFYSGNLLPYYFIIIQAQFFLAVGLTIASISSDKLMWLISLVAIASLISPGFTGLMSNQTAFSLSNKMAAFEKIKQQAGNQEINLSLTVEYPRRGGMEFLTRYYGFDNQLETSRPTYTIVIPANWHHLQPDYYFGDIGVIMPKQTI